MLLYKVVRLFCLKLKISITNELFEFSSIRKLHISPMMVLGYFYAPFDLIPQDAYGASASTSKKEKTLTI